MCFSVNQIDDLQSSNKKQSWTFRLPCVQLKKTTRVKIADFETTSVKCREKCLLFVDLGEKISTKVNDVDPEHTISRHIKSAPFPQYIYQDSKFLAFKLCSDTVCLFVCFKGQADGMPVT